MSSVRVLPLGGTGEIGKNMYSIEYDGRIVLIDCGVTFPSHDQLGVDLVLPDFDYISERRDKLDGILLTHGHEDHIGALPYLIAEIGPVPIYGGKFTLGLVRSKLDEHKRLDGISLIEVEPGDVRDVGPFQAEFFRLTHSIPDCMAVALNTPLGYVLHTGDFKFDHQPVDGRKADIPGLARIGDKGVLLLLADSTNAERSGGLRSERSVGDEFRRLFATAPGRVIVTTFSSHIHRVQQVIDAAYGDGRVVTLIGRSLNRNGNIAINLGYLTPQAGTLVKPRDMGSYDSDEQVIVCTGSQGEHLAALSRMARGEHPQLTIEAGDTVIYSSRTVPGNELAVGETINRLVRLGANVITEESNPEVHVSGHGTSADLQLMLQLTRPSFFAPIHGEARHQYAHAELALAANVPEENISILQNGDILEVDGESAQLVDHVDVGLTYVDGMGISDGVEGVLRDRRHLAEDGLVMVVATVNASEGTLIGEPDVITRGFSAGDDPKLVAETMAAIRDSVNESSKQKVTEVSVLQHQLHDAVAALMKRRTQQRPMVLPVIVEV